MSQVDISAKVTAWASARAVGHGLEFVAWVLLARSLPLGDLGELAVAALVVRYLGLAADWGAQYTGARLVVEDELDGGGTRALSLLRWRQWLCAGFGVAFVAVCVVAGYARFAPLVGALAFRGMNRDWVGLGRGEHESSAIPPVLFGAIVAGGAAIVDTGAGAAWVLGCAGLTSLLVSVVSNPVEASWVRAIKVPSSGPWIMVMTLADQFLATIDVGLLSILDSVETAGVYATIYRLPNAPLLLVGLITTAAVPAIRSGSAGSGPTPEAIRQLRRAGNYAAGLIAIVAMPLIFATGPLFGQDFVRGRRALVVLFAATAVISWTAPFRGAMLAWGREVQLATVFAVAGLANVAANIAVIPRFGMLGAATATLGVQAAIAVALSRLSSPIR